MKLSLNVPINSVSFGQVSIALLKEIFYRSMFSDGIDLSIFPIGQVDLSSQSNVDEDFNIWLDKILKNSPLTHSRKTPSLKLWHLNGGFESFSEKQLLLSFYELDGPTLPEKTIAKDNLTVFTSEYTVETFREHGVDTHYVPLGFDKHNFNILDKDYHNEDKIVFNLTGKFEKRKNHHKTIRAWARKYGNDKRFSLQCAIWNNFMPEDQNRSLFNNLLEGKEYFNIQFLGYMPNNSVYNDYLNSSHVIIGMSGGEGWGLPEFQSVALGKHSVILNCSGYKGWSDNINSVLVEPSGKEEVYDGMFFNRGAPFNQGNIFTFDEDAFIEGCEKAIKRVEINKVNEDGLILQERFTYSGTLDLLLKQLENLQ